MALIPIFAAAFPRPAAGVSLPTPAAYYPLNGSGADASGNGMDLATFSVAYTSGKFSQCLSGGQCSLDSTDWNSFPNGDSGAYSISVWLKHTTALAQGPYIVATDDSGDETTCWLIQVTADGNAYATKGGSDSGRSTAVSLNSWHHVAMVVSTGVGTLYVDGAMIGTITNDGGNLPTNMQSLAIGPNNGAVDDFAIIPAALTAEQVSYLWNSGTGRTYL